MTLWTTVLARRCAPVALACLALSAVLPGSLAGAQSGREKWVGTWSTSTVGRPQTPPPPVPRLPPFMANQCPVAAAPVVAPPPGQTFAQPPFVHFTNQTLRQVIHTSVGGSRTRVVLSNAHGTAPLLIGGGSVALREKDSAIQAASVRPLTFGGRPTMWRTGRPRCVRCRARQGDRQLRGSGVVAGVVSRLRSRRCSVPCLAHDTRSSTHLRRSLVAPRRGPARSAPDVPSCRCTGRRVVTTASYSAASTRPRSRARGHSGRYRD
jgi:hypothetical protein